VVHPAHLDAAPRAVAKVFIYVCIIVCWNRLYCRNLYAQQYQNVSENYQITHEMSDGLKAYTQFTGRQFLIINHDPFDWVDVTVAVNARIRENQVVAESVASAEII
jgi:hypothetical protein